MKKEKIFLGKTEFVPTESEVKGEYTHFEDEDFFIIRNYDQMRPFFMTIVSSTDHWLFLASNGALSAGRRNPENALFPYYTDDKITESNLLTGPRTVIHALKKEKVHLWEPFRPDSRSVYPSRFNIYKNREGNKLIFEEINEQLKLKYCYGWMFSETYGLVKKSWLENLSDETVELEVLDGIQNILPAGVESLIQNIRSTLVKAYKRSELTDEPKVGIYSLSSMIVDKAEPAEALKVSTTWHCGIEAEQTLLSSLQIEDFRRGKEIENEKDIKAENGGYFVKASLKLKKKEKTNWYIVSEVNQSYADIVKLRNQIGQTKDMAKLLEADIAKDKKDLRKLIGLSDGIQRSRDRLASGRHFTNVLFNIMRGGTFDELYEIETADFLKHIKGMNQRDFIRYKRVLNALPKQITFHQLRYFLLAADHEKIFRYYLEYLPLSFSRRHGDPSRPWNYFSIDIKNEKGVKIRNFQGNWRDIFQNWEALAFSFPEYSLSMITKFVNASTIDGYNPYRITREGIDWETVDPNDPWSHIGYWGDHQIIYLSKFVELSMHYHPIRLKKLLNDEIFTYANVPYRIKGYDAITSNPKNTIDYDHELAQKVNSKTKEIGSDGKLVWNQQNQLVYVNLTEKFLVSVLTKLYNFVPGGGLWLNTQRPEWNDANNALVGNGLSVVTICYLKRFLSVLNDLYGELELKEIKINKAVMDLMDALFRGFKRYEKHLDPGFSAETRREFMDDFGIAGEHYRTTAYAGFTGEKRSLTIDRLQEFIAMANRYLTATIERSERKDHLYHAYNLLSLTEGKAEISHLYEMLEGQVAVLSAKQLNLKQTVAVANALNKSEMFRQDQYSYMLYPDRDLPLFLEKNIVPKQEALSIPVLRQMLNDGDRTLVEKDEDGKIHFNSSFQNSNHLEEALANIENPQLRRQAKTQKYRIVALFEKVFKHHEFTGRSGAFYGYEGLGSIYWHMVSKLLMAVQENLFRFKEDKKTPEYGHLIEHYYEIRAGIGVNKSPDLYGAFPTDAYSHTPKYAGAKQPGMTGQVKEDIINRWAELGIYAYRGRLHFDPFILRESEFVKEESWLSYVNPEGEFEKLAIRENSLAFTYCQQPIIYRIAKEFKIRLYYYDGSEKVYTEKGLEEQDSKDIFKRKGKIRLIEVSLDNTLLI